MDQLLRNSAGHITSKGSSPVLFGCIAGENQFLFTIRLFEIIHKLSPKNDFQGIYGE